MIMNRYLILLALGVVSILAVSGVSALAMGGAPDDIAGGISSGDEADDEDDGDAPQDVDDEDDGDTPQDVDDEDDGEEAEDGQGAEKVAQAIADEFEVTPDEVMALHDDGIGFGAIFKLYAIASAMGMSVDDLLATIGTDAEGDHEFAFGQLMKSLTEEQLAAMEEGPKNLGQLVSKANKPEDTDGEEASSAAGAGAKSHGHGPPAFARAHGH